MATDGYDRIRRRRDPPEGSCAGKFRFESYRQALKIARRRLKQKTDGRTALQVYRCLACRGFHLGHSSRD